MGFLSSTPPPAKATVEKKLENIFIQNGRGVIGSIPIVVLTLVLLINNDEMKKHCEKNLLFVFLVMGGCLLFHPVKVPAVAFIPLFAFPLLHIIDSLKICKAYFCANTGLMVVGGYLQQMINASGWDKRFALWLLKPTDSSKSLIVRSSVAAYVLAMISHRQHTTKFIMTEVVGSIRRTEAKKKKDVDFEDFPENRNPVCAILANAIATSSTLGSLAIVNGAYSVMFMRSVWEMSDYPDTFNFLDYSVFALPLTLVMFAMNLGYSIAVYKYVGRSFTGLPALKSSLNSSRSQIPNKITAHEILSLVFTGVSLILYFTRWSMVISKITKNSRGWADSKMWADPVNTKVPDFTVAAGLTILCCMLPSTFNFVKIFEASKESELPPKKADSSIIFWKFVDKHTNYGYMFLVGAFVALHQGIVKCPLFTPYYLDPIFKFMETSSDVSTTLFWVWLSGMLSNIMTSVATAGMLTVVVLHCPVGLFGYKFALATGMASSFGFMAHFKHTPMRTVRTVAGIAQFNQIKYSLGSVIICILMLWLGIHFYAPMIFGGTSVPEEESTTTLAPAAPPAD